MKKLDIKSMTADEIAENLREDGQPPFRSGQIFRWLHQKRVGNFNEMSNLPLGLRDKCNEKYYINTLKIKKRLVSSIDGTVKYLYELNDGNTVEAVLMRYRHGTSICVSTQAGCRMGCSFCASAMGGFSRNLTPAEILDQIYSAQEDIGAAEKISGVVLMGIGEPLDNFEGTLRFLSLLSSPEGFGLSLRHVSLSTCGLVDKIDELARHKLGITLSVSLHAPNDNIRGRLMPIAKKWPMDGLLSACKRYFAITGRRISFEYALIENINDKPEHATELAAKLKGMNCHVNLIPVNAVEGSSYRASGQSSADTFVKILLGRGVNTTVRRRLGDDINAACGQLRRESVGK